MQLRRVKEKDFSYLRRLRTNELCALYYEYLSSNDKTLISAIHFIVGEKELLRYLMVIKNKEVKNEEFERWYANNPRELKKADIKATLKLK